MALLVPKLAAAQPEPAVAPNLYGTGNLRVEMACANYEATPQEGLVVQVDGHPQSALRINGDLGTSYDEDGNPYTTWSATDIGYLVNPGEHHITVTAPGCAAQTADVITAADHAEVISGRLAISDPDLMGTVGAPNGGGLTLGVLSTSAPRGPGSRDGFDTSYTYDPGYTAYGGWLSTSWERRGFELAFDLSFGTGATSGTAMQSGTTKSFTGTAYRFSHAFRIGKRVALRDVSLAGGLGLGYDAWINSTNIDTVGPSEPDASWYVPVWVAATIKPACNWGFQILGEYDLHPTASDNSGMTFGVGWIYQPSDACSQPPSLRVTPNA
ncbi:MAG TPA: hypothetical protein VF403_06985 [Kofleriaceae bacterium]